MKKVIILSAAAVMLAVTGCSESGNTDTSLTETTTSAATTTTTATTATVTSSEPVQTVKKMTITAEVTAFKDDMLTFVYEGKEYTLPFEKKDFVNDSAHTSAPPSLSERIIYNRLGETVYGKISITKDMSRIYMCDVVSTNVGPYNCDLYNPDGTVNRDALYSFRRKEGSLCEIYNAYETLEFDLNDLPYVYRMNYPEEISPIDFEAYKFKDGKMLLNMIVSDPTVTDTSIGGQFSGNDFGKRLCFFGVIQSVDDTSQTAKVLLNDKKTVCTVPTYFNDGADLKEDMEILLVLAADSSLFGSGGEHSFDYAVIITDKSYFLKRRTFEDLAYAEFSGSSFDYTTVANANKQE